MGRVSERIDRLEVVLDDESLVADGGLLAAGTLFDRLGLEELWDEMLRLGDRVGGARPGRKVLSLVSSMLVGGTHIDHADRLRAGATEGVLPHRVMAPSTLGTFLRSFGRDDIGLLDAALEETLRRVWAAGAGPGEAPVTIDVDSTVCEVCGKAKEGAGFGHDGVLSYHPLLATRAETGEIIAARLRQGGSQRGNVGFVAEAVGRVRRAGAGGRITLRADSGFYSHNMVATLNDLGVDYSITVPLYSNVRAAIGAIAQKAWIPIKYPRGGEAQVAETTIWVTHRTKRKQQIKLRLVVRRTRLTDQDQAQLQLWSDWRYHPFVTNTGHPTTEADRDHPHQHTDRQHQHTTPTDTDTDRKRLVEADRHHRRHATIELAIRDLKGAAGLAHLPSGRFWANAAWLAITTLAHNLYRWIAHLGRIQPPNKLTAGATIRNRLFGIPARLVNHSGRHILRLPAQWPWAHTYQTALANLRNLPQLA